MRGIRELLLCLALCVGTARAEAPCPAPAEFLDSAPLPATAGALSTGRLHVLVVGSASSFAAGASGAEGAWPLRLGTVLRERRPNEAVTLSQRGGRGLFAADQWALIEEAIRQERPALVLWQTGATETMRGADTTELSATLAAGLERLRALGVDVVLIDLQFSRFLRANADVAPYREALKLAAGAYGASLFRRYEIMAAWAEAGVVDVERAPREKRAAELDRLNHCLALAMAAFIRDGVRDARR